MVDFDVFGLTTDPLLFTYRELQSICKNIGNKSSSCGKCNILYSIVRNLELCRTTIFHFSFLPHADASSSNDDNRLREESSADSSENISFNRPIQPCLRFLTESRNFRARKTTGQSALANDVMTYMRECVSKK